MKVTTILLFVFALNLVSSQTEPKKVKKYESLLLDTIFKDYDKRSRPVEDYHLAVVVNFSVSFHQILQVDEKHQVVTSNILRTFIWKDEHLKWNPENYGNITQVQLKPLMNSPHFLSRKFNFFR